MTDTDSGFRGYVALTFDDGPNENTETLLATLESVGVRATLFNVGENAAKSPGLVAAEVRAGMWVENHSYTHPHLTELTAERVRYELSATQEAIELAGAPAPALFRPPFGDTDERLAAAVAELGLRLVTWDVDSRDWDGASADDIVAAAAALEDGDVILMHDWPPATIEALPRVVAGLAGRGLGCGSIDRATGRAAAPR